jgi:hypothetical protein
MSIFKKVSEQPMSSASWSREFYHAIRIDHDRLETLCRLLGVAFEHGYGGTAHFINKSKDPK